MCTQWTGFSLRPSPVIDLLDIFKFLCSDIRHVLSLSLIVTDRYAFVQGKRQTVSLSQLPIYGLRSQQDRVRELCNKTYGTAIRFGTELTHPVMMALEFVDRYL